MAPRSRGGGRLNVQGSRGRPLFAVNVQVDGVRKTDKAFKDVRRDVNKVMRDAQEQVGKRSVLPTVQARMRTVAGDWADTLYIKRDRVDVFIGSRLKGAENRAIGWLDFGGQRDRDHTRRAGPHVLARTLEQKQPEIRDQIKDAVLDRFKAEGFEVT